MIMMCGERWSALSPARLGTPLFARSASTPLLRRQQATPDHVEIGQCEHGKQTRRILCQPAVAHLAETPEALDHVESVLATCTDPRAQAVEPTLVLAQGYMAIGTAVDAIADPALAGRLPMSLAPVGLVSVHHPLCAMQQMHHLADVRLIGRRGHQ